MVLAKDNAGNTTRIRSDVFNLDNIKPVIALIGSDTVTIEFGSVYNDLGATASDNIDGDITSDIVVLSNINPNISGSYTVTYNVTDSSGNVANQVVRIVNVSDKYSGPGYVASKGVNGPILATGMTPIKWNGSGWVETTFGDADWYDYSSTVKKWANAKTADGSMWVWIPRFAYRIANNFHSSTPGNVEIKFIKDKTQTASDGTGVALAPTFIGDGYAFYVLHPAFIFGSTQLTGMWISKFEASGSLSNIDIKPGVNTLRSVKIGDVFTAVRNMENNTRYGWASSGVGIDTHMIKNTEWGALAFLSKSIYGKATEISLNDHPDCYAGGGPSNDYVNNIGQSLTGTIYGIYDMAGGVYEYTASYINNNTPNLSLNGSSLINADAKYKNVYTVGVKDNWSNNYAASANNYGDAVYETSSEAIGSTSWYGDYSYMPGSTIPFFIRGGDKGSGNNGGTGGGPFNFYRNSGEGTELLGFRVVLLVDDDL
jgi:hypothetical protein